MKDVIKQLNTSIENGKSVVVTTIIEHNGSSPRHIGSMMLSDEKGVLITGSIGGGAIEMQALSDTLEAFQSEYPIKKEYELTEGSELEMACGGHITVLMQSYISPQLIIVGGGHIGKALSHFSQILDYHVTIIDHREAFSKASRFDGVKCITGDVESVLSEMPMSRDTYIVIVTHGHKYDEVALKCVIGKGVNYIGMIGSKSKIKIIMDHLKEDGIQENALDKVYAPIGLNIGGEKPEEIALGVISQIQSIRYKKESIHYKDVK